MELYVIKFSNGYYRRHCVGFTKDLNDAAICRSVSEARNEAERIHNYPEWFQEVIGGTYEVIEVKLVEA